jgi:Cu/Ag efflux pump CusA
MVAEPIRKRNKDDLIGAMQKRLQEEAPGAVYSFSQPIQMRMQELMEGGSRSDIAVKLFGDDLTVLRQKADQIAAVVSKVLGAADVRAERVAGLPYLRIRIRRDALTRHGLDASDVLDTVQAIGGKPVGEIVFLNIPLAATGGLLALLIRSMPSSISAGVGFIALFGIAVLNGIVLLTYIRDLQRQGLSIEIAVEQGALTPSSSGADDRPGNESWLHTDGHLAWGRCRSTASSRHSCHWRACHFDIAYLVGSPISIPTD